MPHNGLGSETFTATRHEQMFAGWKQQCDTIAEYVHARRHGEIETGNPIVGVVRSGAFLKAIPVLLPIFTQVLPNGWDSPAFVADEKCNGCGTCRRVCSVGNIAIIDNRPAWSNRCEGCFGCLHWCPQEAVQVGNLTVTMKRYHHPEAGIADMIRGTKREPDD